MNVTGNSRDADDEDVVVIGAGPTGLLLACELASAGVRPLVLDRLAEPSSVPKANGILGHSIRMLDSRDLLSALGAAEPHPHDAEFGGVDLGLDNLDVDDLDDFALPALQVPQALLEQVLGGRATHLGVRIERDREVTKITQDSDGVHVEMRTGAGTTHVRASYVVGCDGVHSLVRRQAGIGFPGFTESGTTRQGRVHLPAATVDPDTGEVVLPEIGRLRPGWVHTASGSAVVASFEPEVFVVATSEDGAAENDVDEPLTLEELRASARRVLGSDITMTDPVWLSRVVINSRQADRYRAGRMFLAGDAAHAFGAGGSALNTGLLDAFNLGWKLARHIRGRAPAGLLDSYATERSAAGRRALMHSRAQSALLDRTDNGEALRQMLAELLRFDQPLRHLVATIAGANDRYDLRDAADDPHPMAGLPVPDLVLHGAAAGNRIAEVLRSTRPVLLDLTGGPALRGALEGWADEVDHVVARPDKPLGAVALLVRPDGHVAWAIGADTPAADAGPQLRRALAAWFGPARESLLT